MSTAAGTLLLKGRALCLNVRPFSKTSQMVTWLTEDFGRITTPVKGAQRPKSAFLGKYDIGTTCEVVFYAHDSNGVHHIRECTPLETRDPLRSHWRAAVAANYACDLTLRTAHPGLPTQALFQTLSTLLDTLQHCTAHEVNLALLWFESQLLDQLGVSPDFKVCPLCDPSPRHLFSVEEGCFVCEHRPSRLRKTPTMLLHDEIPQLFDQFIHASLEDLLSLARQSTRVDDLGRPEPFPGIFGLRRFLGVFLNAHLDLLPGPRRTTLDLLIR